MPANRRSQESIPTASCTAHGDRPETALFKRSFLFRLNPSIDRPRTAIIGLFSHLDPATSGHHSWGSINKYFVRASQFSLFVVVWMRLRSDLPNLSGAANNKNYSALAFA